jgi:hypothetical protein
MDALKAVLIGGPEHLTGTDRTREVTDLGQDIKLCCGNGYEHFSYIGMADQLEGGLIAVYEWSGRTMIAE